jgi:hypothetical protein
MDERKNKNKVRKVMVLCRLRTYHYSKTPISSALSGSVKRAAITCYDFSDRGLLDCDSV